MISRLNDRNDWKYLPTGGSCVAAGLTRRRVVDYCRVAAAL